jgi:hypothetical protein
MADGEVSLDEGVGLLFQGAESINRVIKRASLGEQIFGVINTLLVDSERVYGEDRKVRQGQRYEDAKDAKDARICAGCGTDKLQGLSACARCGMPYSYES